MKKILVPLILLFMIGFSSCTITKKSIPMVPVNLQINLDMEDLVYIGDVTGSSSQNYAFGLPIGGRRYFAGVSDMQGQSILPVPSFPKSRGMNNAMYDALMSKPDADFLIPTSYEMIKKQSFLGNTTILKIRAKAYKIKTK